MLSRWFARVQKSLFGSRAVGRRPVSRAAVRARPVVEALERRELMAAAVDFVPVIDRLDPGLMAGFKEAAVGDFDGDGRDDIFYWSPGKGDGAGDNRIAFARGNEGFTIVVNRIPAGWLYDFDHAIVGDFNGDRRDDLFFHNVGEGKNRFVFAGSNETFLPPNDAIRFAPGLINGYARLAAGDFDNNGYDDLFFWAMNSGAHRFHYAFANYQFSYAEDTLGRGALNGATPEIAFVLAGQFDNQPGDDLLFRHPFTGETRFAFRRGSEFAIVDNRLPFLNHYVDAAAGDVNGDGIDDFFLRHIETGNNVLALARSDGSESFEIYENCIDPQAARGYHQSFLGKFDSDGRSDLLSRNIDTGGNLLGFVRDPSFVNLVSGVAMIQATSQNDDLRIHDWQAQGVYAVNLNGRAAYVPRAQVTRFEISLGDGDDHVENNTWVPATIFGGAGNDLLEGGRGNDVLLGEEGNDRLYGKDGEDQLRGGPGADLLEGGANADQYVEVDTADEVVGLEDADVIASVQNEWVDWNDGTVRITGTAGVDQIVIKYDNHAYQIFVNGRVTYLPGYYPKRFDVTLSEGDRFENLTSIPHYISGAGGSVPGPLPSTPLPPTPHTPTPHTPPPDPKGRGITSTYYYFYCIFRLFRFKSFCTLSFRGTESSERRRRWNDDSLHVWRNCSTTLP